MSPGDLVEIRMNHGGRVDGVGIVLSPEEVVAAKPDYGPAEDFVDNFGTDVTGVRLTETNCGWHVGETYVMQTVWLTHRELLIHEDPDIGVST